MSNVEVAIIPAMRKVRAIADKAGAIGDATGPLLTAFVAALALSALGAETAPPPPVTPLARGDTSSVLLAPGETKSYGVELDEGGAIIARVDQEGVDVAVDIFDPAGRKLLTLDSPNGATGPEPIDFTAPVKGLFRIAVRPVEDHGSGHYKLTVGDVLDADGNAARLAAAHYPSPALFSLWKRAHADPAAIEAFVAARKGAGPLIDPVAGDASVRRVTYLYYGNPTTDAVRVSAGPHGASGGILMSRFLQTPLFYASEVVPADARFTYGFASIESERLGPGGEVAIAADHFSADPLNPRTFGGRSLLELPAAGPQKDWAERPDIEHGHLTRASVASAALGETRPVSIYTSPGSGARPADLLLVLDGQLYASAPEADGVPVPSILDNLVADGRIRPVVAIFVDNLPGRRDHDLAANPAFAAFLGKELVAWARARYSIAKGPFHVVAVGSSLGGFAAAYCALLHSDQVGNVLSQSGAFWLTSRGARWRNPYSNPGETGLAIEQFRSADRLRLRFALSIGEFEDEASLFATNREFRDVLLAKGYPVDYVELHGGHEPIAWRSSFAHSLTALIGTQGERRSSPPSS
jgi:enterochelin esterase family protein